ncbi:DUF4124 domain-containing protein [Pseudoduganella eburnea]|uniref:DUF4124 domain-containing protein n=1 Tax=Massilia eburnea TaxID=1776165 RepID=A0A6L6QDN1_9BURK|nr:DUF4124 domain-containing protein [Massilia eburnea]MTW10231.1 DUF4124 domain-containing protein [Massilia eburnea]
MKKALLFAVLGFAAVSQAGAQGLYKCKADGKVTYQSMPCAKGGEMLDVPPPPTPAQVRAAQDRLKEDRDRANQLAERNRVERERKAREEKEEAQETKEANAGKVAAKSDCDKLRLRREELYGQRNDNRRNSQLEAMARTQDEIDKLEASYTKASCGPLD